MWRSVIALAFGLCVQSAAAGTLTINSNASDPAPRAAWDAIVARFQRDHPDVQVRLNVYDHESYKKALRNWLTGAPPDVIFWFAGNRMREFVSPGLLADVSDVFTPDVRAQVPQPAIDLVSVAGRQYGVPYTSYQIGFYYRKDLLDRIGAAPPQDWTALLALCRKLRGAGIEPVAIGSKDLWPTAAWFDYLNLRLNGHAFHMSLMGGQVPYTDPRVRTVFAKWNELLASGCFVKDHASMSWQESQALLYRGDAAMMLIGNFIVANFPPAVADKMEFAGFPVIDPAVPRAEEAPMNSVHIPDGARNKDDAKKFLAYVLRADVQNTINTALLQIPVNSKSQVPENRFLRQGQGLLRGAAGLSQYFDRDTSEDLAAIAMKGFQEFMINPDRLDAVLARIEQARQRIYRN